MFMNSKNMLLSLVLLVTVKGYAAGGVLSTLTAPAVELRNAASLGQQGVPASAVAIPIPSIATMPQQLGFLRRTLNFTLINPTALVSSFIYNNIVCPTLLWGYHAGKYGAMAAGVTALVAPRILREDFTDPGHSRLILLAGGAGLAAGVYFGSSDIKQLEKARGLEALQFVSRDIAALRQQQEDATRQSAQQAQDHAALLQRFAQEQEERTEAHKSLMIRFAREQEERLTEMENARRTAEEQATREREAQATRLRKLQDEQTDLQSNVAAARGDLAAIEQGIGQGNETLRKNFVVGCAALLSSLQTQQNSLLSLALQVRQLPGSERGEYACQFMISLDQYNGLRRALHDAAQRFALQRPDGSEQMALQNSFGPLAQPVAIPHQRTLEQAAHAYQLQLDAAAGGNTASQ